MTRKPPFGVPPGDYSTRPGETPPYALAAGDIVGRHHFWRGDEGDCYVFTERGRVAVKFFVPSVSLPMNPVQLLRWRLGQWFKRTSGLVGELPSEQRP